MTAPLGSLRRPDGLLYLHILCKECDDKLQAALKAIDERQSFKHEYDSEFDFFTYKVDVVWGIMPESDSTSPCWYYEEGFTGIYMRYANNDEEARKEIAIEVLENCRHEN